MKSLRAKGMTWMLIVWGFFVMVFPLLRFVRAAGSSAEHATAAALGRALYPAGITAVLTGFAILAVIERFESLERRFLGES